MSSTSLTHRSMPESLGKTVVSAPLNHRFTDDRANDLQTTIAKISLPQKSPKQSWNA